MFATLALLACRGTIPYVEDPAPPPEPAPVGPCDPLDPARCAFPWPSSYFQAADASSASGVRMALWDDTLPISTRVGRLHPGVLGHVDGFSTLGPILTFVGDVDPADLIGPDRIGDHAAGDARTVILDAETGSRIPHFAELDARAAPGEQALILRPVVPLEHARRYIVALQGLRLLSGEPVPPSEHFRSLKLGLTGPDPDLDWRAPYYDTEIFPILERDGLSRDALIAAWDFTTGSLDGTVGAMLAMRDDALERVGPAGAPYTIDTVEDVACEPGVTIGRTVYGRIHAPRYTDRDLPPARLVRDDGGLPVYQGETDAEFMIRVPCSVLAAPGDALAVQYGHGLLGDLGEARTAYLGALANDRRWVIFAMNWTGMSAEDFLAVAALASGDPSNFPAVPERSMQGFVEKMVGLRTLRGAMRDDPALQIDGQPLLGDDAAYYGNSQGAILGGAYFALSPDLDRGAMGVGGGPYALLLDRSLGFVTFRELLEAHFDDPRDTALMIALMQSSWDVGESAGYARVTTTPLPGVPEKRVLMQVARGDALVTVLGAHVLARAYGAPHVAPAARSIWGIEERQAPFQGSALVEWAYEGVPDEPLQNLPPGSATDTHECPRREPAAQAQLAAFLERGVVEQHCDGPCVGRAEGLCR